MWAPSGRAAQRGRLCYIGARLLSRIAIGLGSINTFPGRGRPLCAGAALVKYAYAVYSNTYSFLARKPKHVLNMR
eukprot:scaffold10075_cov65-Phaeocystis_antarctica.AAC.2